jgi:hypothetical protein
MKNELIYALILVLAGFIQSEAANKCTITGTVNTSGNGATFSFNQLINGGGFDIEKPLPAELLSFEHIVVSTDLSGSLIELNWQTASELNNDRYEVYRSIDGVDFDLIQVVPGIGTSFNINTFSTLDKAADISTTLYYKLVQIDFDGSSETFKILRVNLSNSENQISIYPNPAHDQIELRITNPSNVSTEITITNTNSEVVLTETVNNSVRLDVSEWRTELYFLRATANNTEVVNRKTIIN